MSTRSPYLLAVIAVLALTGTAAAQPSRTFVASTGNDANAGSGCPRSAPCRGFQAAIDAVAAGGEVVALDSAGYGPMTITKSVTVTSEGTHAAITAGGALGIGVNVIMPAQSVTLRNLRILGAPGTMIGINAGNVANVFVENVVVSGFSEPGSYGAAFGENTSVVIRDSVFRETAYFGVALNGAAATIERTRIESSRYGLYVLTGSSAVVRDSVISGHSDAGVLVGTFGAAALAELERCALVDNGYGLQVDGTNGSGNVRARVSDTRISGNVQAVLADAGGIVESFGDNKLSGNAVAGAFTGTLAPQ
jgi:hypothetical protein